MQFRIGDHVKVINEAVEGVISKIADEKKVYLRTPDGFDFLYPVTELIKVNDEESFVEFHLDESRLRKKVERIPDHEDETYPGKKDVSYLRPYLEKGMLMNRRGDAIVEIDLHLEELVTNPKKLNNWEKIHLQVEHCKNCLEEAIRLKITDLVFIHGVGEGRLKQEIRNLIGSYSNMEYSDGEYTRYGMGATHVRIRGLFI